MSYKRYRRHSLRWWIQQSVSGCEMSDIAWCILAIVLIPVTWPLAWCIRRAAKIKYDWWD